MHPSIQLLPLLIDMAKERSDGGVLMPPKQGMYLGPGHFFHAMIASSASHGMAVCKWIGLAPSDGRLSGQQSHSTLLLSELATGKLRRVMDGDPITLIRTVALSLAGHVASRRPLPTSLGFIAGGRQAIEHLQAFLEYYPSINEVHLHEARPRGMTAFQQIASSRGVACFVHGSSVPVLEECDVLVTTVPGTSTELGFLDMCRTRENAFICAVDLGRSWNTRQVSEAAPYLMTDDLPQTQALINADSFPLALPFHTDLPAAISGRASCPLSGRIMFAFAGNAWADLAGAIWAPENVFPIPAVDFV